MRTQRCLRPLLFSTVFFVAPVGTSAAPDPSGITIAVVQSAEVLHAGEEDERVLETKQDVFMGDVIETGDIGEAQILFKDNTKFVVGRNSSVVVDSFVFNEDKTAREVGLNIVRGAFRFISGVSQKQAYSITTPTATLGIRGTQFDLFVGPNEGTSIALYQGEARLCDLQGNCVDLSAACSMAVSGPNGVSGIGSKSTKDARLLAFFPYAVSQENLHPDFRVDVSACGLRKADLRLDTSPEVSPPDLAIPSGIVLDPVAPGSVSPPSVAPPLEVREGAQASPS